MRDVTSCYVVIRRWWLWVASELSATRTCGMLMRLRYRHTNFIQIILHLSYFPVHLKHFRCSSVAQWRESLYLLSNAFIVSRVKFLKRNVVNQLQLKSFVDFFTHPWDCSQFNKAYCQRNVLTVTTSNRRKKCVHFWLWDNSIWIGYCLNVAIVFNVTEID